MSNSLEDHSVEHQQDVKGAEVFVGGLAQSVTEGKVQEVFASCGEILEIRMIKDQIGNSKGYCFVRFSTREAARKAVKDKTGIMLEGRKIGVLPSTDHKSLFLGNLSKDWSPDEFHKMVRQVFHDVVSADLAMPQSDGNTASGQKKKNRGFGFVKFSTHAAAAWAYRMGSKADFVLWGNCHPTVEWAVEDSGIDADEIAKVKVAFVRDLPADLTEDHLKKLFEPYGKLERIVLSKKTNSQVGFVHFAERSDLDNAIKQMNDRSVQVANIGSSFKLQVEVARPFHRNRKRTHDESSGCSSKDTTQSKALKGQKAFTCSSGHSLEAVEEPIVTDPYEATVVSLSGPLKDRLLRILRLGIATRYDIDIQCLRNLKELPESIAISVLDQFMLSGADAVVKGAFLRGLITKHHVRSLGLNGTPLYTSGPGVVVSGGSHLPRLSSTGQMAVDSFSSHMGTVALRYDRYASSLTPLDYSPSAQFGLGQAKKTNTSPFHKLSDSLPSYGRMGMNYPLEAAASHQPMRSQVRSDPFTGEPYKFDPFTGEPIQTESTHQRSGSLY
ncbi:hypothetical protein Ancab_034258 [Ancistrocladus abbreviatus]